MAGKLSIGTAWIEAAAFVRKERRLLAPVVLGLILLPAVVSTMIQPQTPAGVSPEPGSWMIVALVMILLMMIGQMAIVVMVDGWRGSVGEAIGRAARRLPTLVLAALLVMIPLILVSSIVLAAVALATGGGPVTPPSLGGAGWLTILILMVMALVVTVRLLPLVAVVAGGTDGPIAALKRTFRLTRGEFWRLLGFVLLLAIAFIVAAAAVGAVFGSAVVVLLGPLEPWSVSLLLVALAGALVQAAFVTLYTAMLARIRAQLEGSTSAT